jgi:hypothetical protein
MLPRAIQVQLTRVPYHYLPSSYENLPPNISTSAHIYTSAPRFPHFGLPKEKQGKRKEVTQLLPILVNSEYRTQVI